jgi:hypothetical protein
VGVLFWVGFPLPPLTAPFVSLRSLFPPPPGLTKLIQYGCHAGSLFDIYFPRTSHNFPTHSPLFCINIPFFLPLWYLSALFSGGFKSHQVVHDSLSYRDSSTSLFNPWPAEVRGMASTHKDFRAPGRVRPSRQSFTNDDPTVNGKLLVFLYFSHVCVTLPQSILLGTGYGVKQTTRSKGKHIGERERAREKDRVDNT